MIELPYSLIIEATEDPERFSYHSPDLEGFQGVGHSIEDCIYRATWGMREHVEVIAEQGIPIPPATPNPTITVCNEPNSRGGAHGHTGRFARIRQIA